MNVRLPQSSYETSAEQTKAREVMSDRLDEKARIRARVKARLKHLSENEKAAASLLICHLASRLPAFQNARTVGFFSSLPSEPNLDLLMELAWAEGRRVIVPRIPKRPSRQLIWVIIHSMEDLVPSSGKPKTLLMEPRADLPEVPLDQLDCLFVPGLAFDQAGWRLGRGGGYYDSALSEIKAQENPIPHPGLMFACQEVEKIPTEPHDQRLACILTEEGMRLFPCL